MLGARHQRPRVVWSFYKEMSRIGTTKETGPLVARCWVPRNAREGEECWFLFAVMKTFWTDLGDVCRDLWISYSGFWAFQSSYADSTSVSLDSMSHFVSCYCHPLLGLENWPKSVTFIWYFWKALSPFFTSASKAPFPKFNGGGVPGVSSKYIGCIVTFIF